MPRLIVVSVAAFAIAACGDNNSAKPDAPSSSSHVDAPPIDAFQFLDAPADPTGIATAIGTPDGTTNVSINNVTVTYIKPFFSTPDDPAGFTIQANQQGPGLFVEVDPSTLTPAFAVGDVASFTITEMTTVATERRAETISNTSRSATGTNVSALARDVSNAADLLANIGAYDSTLVSVAGTFGKSFANSGTGFQSAEIDTVAITGQTGLTFRVPATLVDQLDMAQACTVTATDIPFDRFNSTAELGAYSTSDFVMNTCPAPVIASALATSATTVNVTFTRRIDPTTLDVTGSQFTLDGGVTVTAAALSARTITLTTSAQTPNTTYTLNVGTGLADLMGNAFVAPMTAPTFPGYTVQAGVVINELNANITGGCDLIELRVTSDGSMSGFRITERLGSAGASGELDYTFPQGFNVTKNAIVMFHESSGSGACNPNGATQELTTTTDQGSAMFAGNYDTAFDFWGSDAGLTATDNVITLYDGTGTIVDAVFLTSGSGAQDTLAAANADATAGQWASGAPPYTATTFAAAAVQGLGSTAKTSTGTSIQRNVDADTNTAADWTTAAETFGVINAGQATLMLRHRHR
jgi:hypothetical protein